MSELSLAVPLSAQVAAAGVVELHSGVDAFYSSGYGVPPPEFVAELERLQAAATEAKMAQPVDLGGVEFMVQPHGMRQYTYLLVHPYGRIGVTTSEQFPTYRIQPLSVALLGLGAPGAVNWFENAVRSFDPSAEFHVSRLDLCCDVQGWTPAPEAEALMVCRSRHSTHHFEESVLTGLTFGRRKTGGVMLRIYDKKREAHAQGLDYMAPLWGERHDPAEPVWRVEFEIGRKALVQYGMDSTGDVFERIGGVWAAITDTLYRLAVESPDETKSRWPTDPVWELIQTASLRGGSPPIERMLEYKRIGTLRTLQAPLTGMLSSVGALIDASSVDEVLDQTHGMVRDHEVVSGRTFGDRVEEKRRR